MVEDQIGVTRPDRPVDGGPRPGADGPARLGAAALGEHRADPVLVSLGASGELIVSRVRLLLLVVLLGIQFVPGISTETRRVTVPLNVVALVVAMLFYWLASRRPQPWMEGFASSAAVCVELSPPVAFTSADSEQPKRRSAAAQIPSLNSPFSIVLLLGAVKSMAQ